MNHFLAHYDSANFPFCPSDALTRALECRISGADGVNMNTADEIMELMNEAEELKRRLVLVQWRINEIYREVPGDFLEPLNADADVWVDKAVGGRIGCFRL